MRKGTLCLLFVLLLPGFSISQETQSQAESHTVHGILRKWIAVENALSAYRLSPDAEKAAVREEVIAALDDTALTIHNFTRDYRYHAYSDSSFSLDNRVQTILALLDNIAGTVNRGDTVQTKAYTKAAREAIITWQEYDTEQLNRIQMSYVYQNIIFILTVLALVSCLVFIHRALRYSQAKSVRSTAFFRDIMLAQEEERSRIALELHDTVIPEIRSLSFSRQGNEVTQICDTLILRLREICQALIPPDFIRFGLAKSLHNLCAGFEKRSGIECRLVIQEGLRLAPLAENMQLQCFRLIQEALSNIEKHSGASEASVMLHNGNDSTNAGAVSTLLICVTDDGRGFDMRAEEAAPEEHLGIRGMYSRMDILGGTLSFSSGKDEGVMVRMEIPLE
jgi:signal transduction histidine kinase